MWGLFHVFNFKAMTLKLVCHACTSKCHDFVNLRVFILNVQSRYICAWKTLTKMTNTYYIATLNPKRANFFIKSVLPLTLELVTK